jgi:hypothetical protein
VMCLNVIAKIKHREGLGQLEEVKPRGEGGGERRKEKETF